MSGEEVCNFGYAVFLALLTYHMACFFMTYMGPVWRWLWDSLVRSRLWESLWEAAFRARF